MRLILISTGFLLTACTSGPAEFIRRPEALIGWPAEDPEPRIEVSFVYHDTRDVKRQFGFWQKVKHLFVGREPSQLISPYGMCMTGEEELLVADTAQGAVHRISMRTGRHKLFDGGEDYPLVTPVGVAVVPDGRIFVTDSSAARVVVFTEAGKPIEAFGDADELGRPTGIAYDALRDRLLIVDTTGGRLLSYSLDGRWLAETGGRGGDPGHFNYPTNVTVSPEGTILVMDSFNFRVQVLNSDLSPQSEFGIVGSGPGTFSKPKGIALDAEGHVFVVDGMFDNVQIFDASGQHLMTFCESGRGFGGLSLPTGILIDEQQRIFVADSGNARIHVFQFHGRQD